MKTHAAATAVFLFVSVCGAQNQSRELRRQPLPPPFDGREARVIEVTIPPGEGSPPHHHPGFVLGYVLEGELKFATEDDPPRILKAGEVFYEAPDILHSTSASARPDRPVKILVFFVGGEKDDTTIPLVKGNGGR